MFQQANFISAAEGIYRLQNSSSLNIRNLCLKKKMFVLGEMSSKPLSYMMKSLKFRYIFFCGDGSLFRVPGRLFQFCEWLLAVSLALCYAVLF